MSEKVWDNPTIGEGVQERSQELTLLDVANKAVLENLRTIVVIQNKINLALMGLQKLEWHDLGGDGYRQHCPVCGRIKRNGHGKYLTSHAPQPCWLGELIRGLE